MTEQRVWWIDSGEDAEREFHRATCEWVAGLGLSPDWLLPYAEVCERDDGVFEFRAEQIVPDASGKPQFDPNHPHKIRTVSVAISVQRDSWPARPTEATV